MFVQELSILFWHFIRTFEALRLSIFLTGGSGEGFHIWSSCDWAFLSLDTPKTDVSND